METIEDVRSRVKTLVEKYNDEIDLLNDDGEGIVLDSTGYADVVGGVKEEFNIELRLIYENLYADTNIGTINLIETIKDIDDWYTIEDIVKDLIDN